MQPTRDKFPAQTDLSGGFIWVLITAAGGAALGAFVGWLMGKPLAGVFGDIAWLPKTRLGYAILFAVLGGLNGLWTSWTRLRRQQKTRTAAESLGMEFAAHGDRELERGLQEMFSSNAFMRLTNVVQKQVGESKMLFADLRYRTSGDSDSSYTVQTIAYVECPGMNLPAFTLQPEGKLLTFFTDLVGVKDIDFDSHPRFSGQYHLSSAHAGAVRRLFNDGVLSYFENHPGYEVRGDGSRLVFFQRGKRRPPEQLEDFVRQSTEVFALFESAEYDLANTRGEAASRTPDAPAAPLQDALEGVAGPLAGMIRGRLVTQDQAAAFMETSAPRQLPANVRRAQLPAGGLMLIPFGGIFALVGIGMLAFALFYSSDPWGEEDRFVPALIGAAFSLVGAPLVVGTVLFRFKKKRLLVHGQPAEGKVVEVKPTNVSINNQRRYLAIVEYESLGRDQRGECRLYGASVKVAEQACNNQATVRLLYDQNNPARVLIDAALVNLPPNQWR